MVFLRSFGLVSKSWIMSESPADLKTQLELPKDIKLYRNGKLVEDNDIFEQNDLVEIVGGLLGGKGGFGSMLRALGNQIQKTTNKEACRDLSGRRLRDINEEKRMKSFVSKQADRYVFYVIFYWGVLGDFNFKSIILLACAKFYQNGLGTFVVLICKMKKIKSTESCKFI